MASSRFVDPCDPSTEASDLERARGDDTRALSSFYRRHHRALRDWMRGRLPRWARSVSDTADIVQEALLRTFRRLDKIEDRGRGALQAYLRQVAINCMRDEVRRVARAPFTQLDESTTEPFTAEPSPFDATLDAENESRYKATLSTLTEEERILVVGRLELGYNYDQLALVGNRPSAQAARQAVRRAVKKVAERMAGV